MGEAKFLTALEAELHEDDLAASTIERTMIDTRQLFRWFAETNGVVLDPEDVQIVSLDLREYRGWLQRKDMTPGTVQRKFASIRKAIMLSIRSWLWTPTGRSCRRSRGTRRAVSPATSGTRSCGPPSSSRFATRPSSSCSCTPGRGRVPSPPRG